MTLNVQQQPGKVTLSGSLTNSSAVSLWHKRTQLFTNSDSDGTLVFELTALSHTDSAGLATLVALIKAGRASHCRIKLCNPTPQLLAIARLSGIQNLLTIHQN